MCAVEVLIAKVIMREEKFTWQLAIVDVLPVLFFCIAVVVLGLKLQSIVFFTGAVICILAGAGKVLWKFLIALVDKDIKLLGVQLRYLMSIGFTFIVIGSITADHSVVLSLVKAAVRMPSLLFFIIAALGICGMIFCARRYDRHDVRGNWIEQGINIVAQGCVLLGVWFI